MIVPTLLRLMLFRALMGRTLAGLNVCDSRLGLIDETVSREEEYVIVVTSGRVEFDDLFRADSPEVSVVIEMMVTSRMDKSRDADGKEIVREIPVTHSGLELTLGMLAAQTLAALRDPENPWSRAAKRLMVGDYSADLQRGGNEKNSTLRAALQIVLSANVLSEPVLGEPLEAGTSVADAIALMETDDAVYGLSAYGQALRLLFEGAPALVDTQASRSALAPQTVGLLNFEELGSPLQSIVIDTPLPGDDE